jgi:two-component system, NarL family, response regulator NreC
MKTKIRLLLADDHAILRAGLRMLLEAQPDMTVVAEASDGEEALRRARETRPDVAVVDLTMPGLSGVETLERLHRECPATRLLVLTMHDDPAYARVARAAGASGHVIKDSESAELLAAIRAVHRGRVFVQVGADASPAGPPASSARAHALSHREIAHRLSLSTKTVETHRSRLGDKLGLHTRAELVRLALDLGLIR